MKFRLEHANICVHDIDGVVKFLQTAFPEFQVRHDGVDRKNVRWVHVGTCLLYTSPSPRDLSTSRMPSSA